MRQTIQKQVILDYIKSVKTHPSAETVFAAVKDRVPSISFGTVYRNLKQLTAQGQIKELCFDRECLRYDADLKDHQHFVCLKCGRVYDDFGRYTALRQGLSRHGKFKIVDVDITVRGYCPKCKNYQIIKEKYDSSK